MNLMYSSTLNIFWLFMSKYVFMYFYFMLPEIEMKEQNSVTNLQVLNQKANNKARNFNGILEEVN